MESNGATVYTLVTSTYRAEAAAGDSQGSVMSTTVLPRCAATRALSTESRW